MTTAAVKCPYCHSPRPLPADGDSSGELLIRCSRCYGMFTYIFETGKVRFRSRRSWYDVLGVSVTASSAEIAARYRELTERFGDRIAEGRVPGLQMLDEACAVLSDLDRRAEYDASLLHDGSGETDDSGASGSDRASSPSSSLPAFLAVLFVALLLAVVTVTLLLLNS